MRTTYYCGKCGMDFGDKDECLKHEESCSTQKIFQCQKCGKVVTWDMEDEWRFARANQCHTVDLGVMGYGSKLDGLHLVFDVCDDCIISILNTFKYRDDVVYPFKWNQIT